jgi:hypothetical protein
MAQLNFRCFSCNQVSGLRLTAEGRDRVYRLRADPNLSKDITFYCDRCGVANTITLTVEMIATLIDGVTSDDPEIQKAIDEAKRGNLGAAIDQARRRFGF